VVTRYHPRLPYYGRFLRFTGNMLMEGNTVWMSDGPEERLTMSAAVRWCPPGSDVLVGGLGLGIFPRWINDRVNSMTIVELSRDVINLVYHHIRTPKMTLVHGDIEEYLRTTGDTFDYIFLDTWPDTGGSRLPEVTYLKALAKSRLRREHDRVMCWGERRMRGELLDRMMALARIYEEYAVAVACRIMDERFGEGYPGVVSFARWLLEQPVPLAWPKVQREARALIEEYALSGVGYGSS